MNTGIKHLIEHIICFNPAILDNRKVKSKVDKDIVKSMLLNDTTEVLWSVFHMPVPDKWSVVQNEKLNRNEILIEFDHKESMPIAAKRVIKQLTTKYGFNRYDASSEPYAFIHNTDIACIRRNVFGLNTIEGQTKIRETKKKLEEWKQKFESFPSIVQEYFRESPIYKTIWISPDNGVIMTLETADDTGYELFDDEKFKDRLRISITGEVTYQEDTEEEKEQHLKEYNDAMGKMKFFDRYLRDLSSIIKNKYCKFFICDNGLPFYICFFNMEDQIKYAQGFLQKKRIPGFLYDIINVCHVPLLPQYEKEDKTSLYEFEDQAIHILVYDHIDEYLKQYINSESVLEVKNKNKMKTPGQPDGCIIVKLDSYLLDMYNEKYNKQ